MECAQRGHFRGRSLGSRSLGSTGRGGSCPTPPPPFPSPRLHHPSSPPPSHSQPLLPRPATCSLTSNTPSLPPNTRSLAPPPVRSSAPLHRLRPNPTPPLTPSPPGWLWLLGCPSVLPDHGPPRRGAPHVPAGAGVACAAVRLSPPVLRIGLRWLPVRGSGNDPAGCE